MPDTPVVVTKGGMTAPQAWMDRLQDGLDAALHALQEQRHAPNRSDAVKPEPAAPIDSSRPPR